jgi:hypothetical protein
LIFTIAIRGYLDFGVAQLRDSTKVARFRSHRRKRPRYARAAQPTHSTARSLRSRKVSSITILLRWRRDGYALHLVVHQIPISLDSAPIMRYAPCYLSQPTHEFAPAHGAEKRRMTATLRYAELYPPLCPRIEQHDAAEAAKAVPVVPHPRARPPLYFLAGRR